MRVAQSSGGRPALSAIKLRKMDAGRHTTVLLDGGATNCLRRARSDQEYQQAEPVQVSLASGSVHMRQSPQSRTLLVKEEVQPIVPLSDLINIGVSIEWNDRGCKMKHAGRILPVFLDEGCPVIGLTEGLDLVRQVEEFHERRAKLRLAVARVAGGEELPAGHDLEEVEAVNFAEDFPEVPPRLIERVPGKVRWDPALVPMNRRLRKRIQKAKTVKHLHRRYEQRMAARLEERQRNNASQRSSWTLRSDRHLQRLMALSTKEQIELADWQYHINNGHVPFRRDCYQCQESQGRDRHRRRIETPQGYTLNFDISGPLWSRVWSATRTLQVLPGGIILGSISRLNPTSWGLAMLRRRQYRALRCGAG